MNINLLKSFLLFKFETLLNVSIIDLKSQLIKKKKDILL
jgi:hypothetical protein